MCQKQAVLDYAERSSIVSQLGNRPRQVCAGRADKSLIG